MRLWTTTLLLALLTGCGDPPPIKVPETFKVKFITSAGDIVVETQRAWSPRGVDRFHELLRTGYFNEGRFYRVVPGFIAQFGVHKDFTTHRMWRQFFILDDPRVLSNTRGTLTFAQDGPTTRATEMFFNLRDNPVLDEQKFTPFARVIQGMDVVDRLYSGYGEMKPEGQYIDSGRVEEATNDYLVSRFPKLDYVKKTEILP
jgi:peptidyl-prolyl cis-trans isomerase A (cyclophilin A)